jgi:hypothetical protein
MTTDEEAEAFLASDLSDADFSQFTEVRFEFSTGARRLEREFRFRASSPGGVRSVVVAPGGRAPKSGVYQQIGPRGGRHREQVTAVVGDPLPPAPAGRAWTLLTSNEHKPTLDQLSRPVRPARRRGASAV